MSERLTEERFAYIFEYRQSEELLEGAMADELFAELAAQAEEIRRLREALEPFADAHRNHTRINWDDEECRRAAKAMEG